jgi:hypothetical protein
MSGVTTVSFRGSGGCAGRGIYLAGSSLVLDGESQFSEHCDGAGFPALEIA